MNNDKQLTPEEHQLLSGMLMMVETPCAIEWDNFEVIQHIRDYVSQQTASKEERIKELEDAQAHDILLAKETLESKDARIAELEKDAKTMYDKMNGKIRFEKDKNTQLHEKVKRLEKDILTWEHGCDKLIAERDQAFDLLEQWQKREPAPHNKKFNRIATSVLRERDTLLSSRESKKP